MDNDKDFCPISDTGNHRYFIFKVVEVFEPLNLIVSTDIEDDLREDLVRTLTGAYKKVEYAVSGCNCGSSIKVKVKQL